MRLAGASTRGNVLLSGEPDSSSNRWVATSEDLVTTLLKIRPAIVTEVPFLEQMLVEAAYWRGDAPATVAQALAPHELAILLAGWGRPGDSGVVAVKDTLVGAAWYRLWTDEVHSYGFVDEATPELAIGVRPAARGRGVGGALLDALFERARADGYASLSLSVSIDNPARRLYERKGFRRFATVGDACTMRVRL